MFTTYDEGKKQLCDSLNSNIDNIYTDVWKGHGEIMFHFVCEKIAGLLLSFSVLFEGVSMSL